MHLVLELCQGNLEDLVRTEKKLREPLAAAIVLQVMRAVEHCHQQNIVHRDLKLDNIMLSPQREGMGLMDGVPHVRVMCASMCVRLCVSVYAHASIYLYIYLSDDTCMHVSACTYLCIGTRVWQLTPPPRARNPGNRLRAGSVRARRPQAQDSVRDARLRRPRGVEDEAVQHAGGCVELWRHGLRHDRWPGVCYVRRLGDARNERVSFSPGGCVSALLCVCGGRGAMLSLGNAQVSDRLD